MPNRLAKENSPYLLQHKDNPVDWYPWGEEALSKARDEHKPIFLSIGYAACHWCHVMEHESFEDTAVATYMNRHFVNIKVDREERPDIDSIYMKAVVAMTGQGGWPMSVFLTPDGKPFFGGTYYPPLRRYNMPSFLEVLQHIAQIWNNEQAKIRSVTEQLIEYIRSDVASLPVPDHSHISPALLDQVSLEIAKSYDWKNGGWGKAPKFPQPMTIEFLLRKGIRGDTFAIEMAEHALIKMSAGGMYDLVGGGFSRYSVDNVWLVPHFEKMLYDNAQLSNVYLYAYLITKKQVYLDICQKTLNFIASEMLSPEGGFFSSLDADSEGKEGIYYSWPEHEINQIILDPSEREIFKTAYNITPQGNFEGANVLQQLIDITQLSSRYGLDHKQIHHILTKNLQKLYEYRQARVRPHTDDKVLAGWNGLMLFTFSEAARYLGNSQYRDIAVKNANFILNHLYKNNVLYRSWRLGQAKHAGTLEDYSAIILGLISLYYTDRNVEWFNGALRLTNQMVLIFDDPAGGFFDTATSENNLIVRPKDVQDNAVPSGNALAVLALLHMSALTGNNDWRNKAELSIQQLLPLAVQYPTAFAKWLCALDTLIGPLKEIGLVYATEDLNFTQQYQAVWSAFAPNQVVATSPIEAIWDGPALLQHKSLLNNQSTTFICENFVCDKPVNSAAELRQQLSGSLRL